MAAFINVLNVLISNLSLSNLPTIILGDFNDDVYDNTHSRVLAVMSNHGYAQLVQSPTTDRGSLIDHIYYNRPAGDTVVEIYDTYYSDNDTVYCSVVL